MHRRIAAVAAVALAICVLTACASERARTDPPVALPAPTETLGHGEQGDGPPPFVVRYGDSELRLAAAGWCYRSACADGMDVDPPSVGSPEELLVFVPGADFDTLSATQFTGERHSCDSRAVETEVEDLGGGWWQIHPRGPADDYTFDLFASGSGGLAGVASLGTSSVDMFASFRWTTDDAPMPPASAGLVLIVDHDGEPDSYGLELSVAGLTEQPREYSATITVTASNGRSLTFDAQPADFCTGVGSLYFDGPDAKGKAAARLGDFPFSYDVVLVLDGKTFTATAEYADNSAGINTPLEFTPALP